MSGDTKPNIPGVKKTFQDGVLERISLVRPPGGEPQLLLSFNTSNGGRFSTPFLYTGGVMESSIQHLNNQCPQNVRLNFIERDGTQERIHSVEIESGPTLIAHWGF